MHEIESQDHDKSYDTKQIYGFRSYGEKIDVKTSSYQYIFSKIDVFMPVFTPYPSKLIDRCVPLRFLRSWLSISGIR